MPLLLDALRQHHFDLLPVLCDAGVDVNHKTPNTGQTALLFSVTSYQTIGPPWPEFLLKRGADPNLCDCLNRTPLHYAVCFHNIQLVDLLLKHGADPNLIPRMGGSCLHLIAGRNEPHCREIMMMLLKNKAHVNIQNAERQTPIYNAIRHKITANVKLLLENGADPNNFDDCNRTPLHQAMSVNEVISKDIVELLLKYNAFTSSVDCYSFTPFRLSLASYASNSVDIGCILVKHGAIEQDCILFHDQVFMSEEHARSDNRTELLRVMFLSGVKGKRILEELKDRSFSTISTVSGMPVLKDDAQSLMQLCKIPMKVQWLCRMVIRQEIIMHTPGCSIHKFIDMLEVPRPIKDFLSMLTE